MGSEAIDWRNQLFRKGPGPSAWLSGLVTMMDQVLRDCVSSPPKIELLEAHCYGGLLDPQSEAYKGLLEWEDQLNCDLLRSGDALSNLPSQTLPLLLRELAAAAGPDGSPNGFSPVGVVPRQLAHITGWLKNLSAEGCLAYQREREAGHTRSADWVPRQSSRGGGVAASEAQGVMLPIFFVGGETGLNGWLRLWLWPCQGAQLTPLPSVVQRSTPLTKTWEYGLAQAHAWLLQQMNKQGGDWVNHALVWKLDTEEQGHYLLEGPSASAAFAIASLWLVRHWAPPHWQAPLCSLTRNDWLSTHITASIQAEDAGGFDLALVGSVGEKAVAQWVLSEGKGCAHLRPPLHVASAQQLNKVDITLPRPWLHRHHNALALVQTLGRRARNLSEAQSLLLGALQPNLPAFAPLPAPPAATDEEHEVNHPWHLPQLDALPIAADPSADWASAVTDIVQDTGQPPAHLVPFALTRWAARAHGQHEGGQVHSLFVNLVVSDEDRPPVADGATCCRRPKTEPLLRVVPAQN